MEERSNSNRDNSRQPDAVELQRFDIHEGHDPSLSTPSKSSEEYCGVAGNRRRNRKATTMWKSHSTHATDGGGSGRRYCHTVIEPWRWLKEFWARNVALAIPEKGNRDHLGEFTTNQ